MIARSPVGLDWASAVTIAVGIVITTLLLIRYVRRYRRQPSRWAFRAVVMLAVTAVVWLGSSATLIGRFTPVPIDIAQWFALGSRLTLLAMVIWLALLPRLDDDHGQKAHDTQEGERRPR